MPDGAAEVRSNSRPTNRSIAEPLLGGRPPGGADGPRQHRIRQEGPHGLDQPPGSVSANPFTPSTMIVGSSVVASPTTGSPTVIASHSDSPRLV